MKRGLQYIKLFLEELNIKLLTLNLGIGDGKKVQFISDGVTARIEMDGKEVKAPKTLKKILQDIPNNLK